MDEKAILSSSFIFPYSVMKSANTDELCLTYGARAASDNGIYQSPGEVHDEILVQLDFFAGVLHSEDGAVEVWGKLPSIINFIIRLKVLSCTRDRNFNLFATLRDDEEKIGSSGRFSVLALPFADVGFGLRPVPTGKEAHLPSRTKK